MCIILSIIVAEYAILVKFECLSYRYTHRSVVFPKIYFKISGFLSFVHIDTFKLGMSILWYRSSAQEVLRSNTLKRRTIASASKASGPLILLLVARLRELWGLPLTRPIPARLKESNATATISFINVNIKRY